MGRAIAHPDHAENGDLRETTLPDADAKRLPEEGVHVEIVPEAGHLMAWENPAGLALALRGALEPPVPAKNA